MIDDDESEMSDIDPEEMARLVQDVDDLDADMFGLKLTKPKAKASKSPGPSLKTSSPTSKTTEPLSGKSRLLAEMFPARSDWLGLQDEPKEAAVPTAAPISPLAPRRSRGTAPVVTSTAIESTTERPKFMPTPRRPRTGPSDPLGLFQSPQEGQTDTSQTDPALPSWLGGVQTPTFLRAAHNKSAQEPTAPEQPMHPINLIEKSSQHSTDPPKQVNYTMNQLQQTAKNVDSNIKTTDFVTQSNDSSNILGNTELSNNLPSFSQQLSYVNDKASLQKPLQQATNSDQPNFQYESKHLSNIQDQLVKVKPSQDPILQPNSLAAELHRLSADLPDTSRQPSLHADNITQYKSPQESYKTPLPIQQESFQRPIIERQTSQVQMRQNESQPPSPRQLNLGYHLDAGYREDHKFMSAHRDPQMDHDEYQRDRDRRLERESRYDRDSRLERLLETLISRSNADAQLDGQRMRRELDVMAASLRDEMAALAGSRRRDLLAQEAALGEQREVARGMDTLGTQLKGLAEALAEHRQSWQRDTAALQAVLTQNSEPAAAQQAPANQHSLSNGHLEFQDKRVNLQQDTLSLHASQAYFAQDVKQEIRSAFKEMHQEVSEAGKLSKQSQQEFVAKVERERVLFADEIKQGRDLLVREMKRQEEAMAEIIRLEIASFNEDKRRQRSEFVKEMEEVRQENFEAMMKERAAFTEILKQERSNFKEELKQERTNFLARLKEERDVLVAHTSSETARFSKQLTLSSSALAAEMQRERDALAARETALTERESELRWRNESLANAARDLQRMAAAAVDARDQGNAALSAAEQIEGRECARAAELSAQLAQLRDVERARVARRLAQASQQAVIDFSRSLNIPSKISLMRLQAQHNFTMVEADTQLFESLCSVSK